MPDILFTFIVDDRADYRKLSYAYATVILTVAAGQKCRRSKLPSVKNAVVQNGRRSKIPSVKMAVGQKFRRSKWSLVKNSVGQNDRRSKLRRSKDLEPILVLYQLVF
jgi:predicted NAD-dependent protein-ADP-ribosyltransferase YbiA (DUF1768 family)